MTSPVDNTDKNTSYVPFFELENYVDGGEQFLPVVKNIEEQHTNEFMQVSDTNVQEKVNNVYQAISGDHQFDDNCFCNQAKAEKNDKKELTNINNINVEEKDISNQVQNDPAECFNEQGYIFNPMENFNDNNLGDEYNIQNLQDNQAYTNINNCTEEERQEQLAIFNQIHISNDLKFIDENHIDEEQVAIYESIQKSNTENSENIDIKDFDVKEQEQIYKQIKSNNANVRISYKRKDTKAIQRSGRDFVVGFILEAGKLFYLISIITSAVSIVFITLSSLSATITGSVVAALAINILALCVSFDAYKVLSNLKSMCKDANGYFTLDEYRMQDAPKTSYEALKRIYSKTIGEKFYVNFYASLLNMFTHKRKVIILHLS